MNKAPNSPEVQRSAPVSNRHLVDFMWLSTHTLLHSQRACTGHMLSSSTDDQMGLNTTDYYEHQSSAHLAVVAFVTQAAQGSQAWLCPKDLNLLMIFRNPDMQTRHRRTSHN